MRKDEVRDREKMISYAMLIGILFGMFIIFNGGKGIGKLELCHDIGGVLATDGKCYDALSFEIYNKSKPADSLWYNPTGTLPKLNLTLNFT